MSLSRGTRLGPYEIVSLVGAGGMGEVYKARDTRLDRTVAVKLLPAGAAERSDRRARFEIEARAISSLSHPHICTLFDVGDQDGRPFIIMEFLDGETLDDRLSRGPLPAGDVLRFALQMADALAHAHRAHIVHRDLKPGNVMLTAAGAKLLDFGLARRPVVVESGASLSTVSFDQRKLTAEGTILGTFQYMAPEQLEGKEADARTDIFAFGTLLYEMATGRKAFEGGSQASLIASILTAHPPPISSSQTDRGLPPSLDHILARCLAKNPDDRWQTARDLKLELEWIAGGDAYVARAASAPSRSRVTKALTWAGAGIVIAAVAIGGAVFRRTREPLRDDVTRFVVTPPLGSVISSGEQTPPLAISPDGRQIAFVAITDGRSQIWVRPLDNVTAQPVPGTEGAATPFWSPVSKFIGFVATDRGELKKIALGGGPARTIYTGRIEGLPHWGADGTILLSLLRDGVFRVPAEGGTPARVTALDKSKREINHYWPRFLPDGKHFIYLATANDSDTSKATPSVYVASLDGSSRTALPRIHSRAIYAAPGYLMFMEEGALLAQPFDVASLRLSGEATRIADGISAFRSTGGAGFSVSDVGTLAYRGSGEAYQIMWYDRRGDASEGGWATQTYGSVRISPDGREALVDVYDPRYGEADIWVYDLARNVPRRFIADPASDRNGVWSPDAQRVVYTTERGSSPNLFAKAVDGTGEIQTMVVNPGPIFAEDWSSDNLRIAYTANTRQTGLDLWIKPLDGDTRGTPFLATPFDEMGGRFSPDGKWLAFTSTEAGRTLEIYVAPVGNAGQRRQLSIGGGTTPRWRRDGKELFYVSTDGRSIMTIAVDSLEAFKVGKPERLFSVGRVPIARDGNRGVVYDVSPDGQRFLISLPYGEPASSRMTVVMNWSAGINR